MLNLKIEGGSPLIGGVSISGSIKNAIRMLYASMYSNGDIYLNNVPRVRFVERELEILRYLGAKAEWESSSRLLLNCGSIKESVIPIDLGSATKYSHLAAGPLLFRFGKAGIPKMSPEISKFNPVNRLVETLQKLNVDIEETKTYYNLQKGGMAPAEIAFRTPTHTGTDHAILTSLFLDGETAINNASQEVETDSLIAFLNSMGARVERTEPSVIKIIGTTSFVGCTFDNCFNKDEAVLYMTAAVLTGGNMEIRNIKREYIISFSNFLMKVGAKFEFGEDSMRVWKGTSGLEPVNVIIARYPGIVPNWQPMVTTILTQASGRSLVHDTIYTNRFDYIKDLNRMGANIKIGIPSDYGLAPIISEDSYDVKKSGEPSTVAEILGPSKLKGIRTNLFNQIYSEAVVLAALVAEGKSEIQNADVVEERFMGFYNNISSLGAKINAYTN